MLHRRATWKSPNAAAREAVAMGKKKVQPNYRRRTLRLPDLDHSKLAVLNSLGSPGSRRVYEFALDQFIAWYCSEPRLAFNRIVVTRYRMYLESRALAANTINQQLAAVRRLAYEAADAGLLSPELAAGISRVKGVADVFEQSTCADGQYVAAYTAEGIMAWRCQLTGKNGGSPTAAEISTAAPLNTKRASICDSISVHMKKEDV
jgi:hypothetical protein